MDSSKEKIEAQLCAYVEGELDDADRADIERHLQTNPQHKSLLAELRRHRELLQTLPRATIPGDLNENLTGQLERSALLSDDDETAEANVRINRWPQLTAVAAVILLATGLGIVVYYVLPPAGGGHNVATVANAPQPKSATAPSEAEARSEYAYGVTPATEPAKKLAAASADALSDVASRDLKLTNNTPAATPAPMPSVVPAENKSAAIAPATPLASATDSTAQRLRDLTSGPGLVTSGEVEELQKRMRNTLGGEANAAFNLEPRSSVYLIVQTPDAVATSGQVALYFKTNNIQYMNYEGPPIDLGAPTDALAKAAEMDSDLAKGGALGGGLSSPSQLGGRSVTRAQSVDRARSGVSGGYGGFGGGGGAAGPRQQASGDARRGAEAAGVSTETLTQKQESFGRAGTPTTQPDGERLYRRGLVRNEDFIAAGASPASRPAGALSVAPKSSAGDATPPAPATRADAGAKAKADAPAIALGDKNELGVKDELSLSLGRTAGTSPGAAPQPAAPEAGQQQNAQASQPPARGRFVPGDANWNMRLGGPDGNASRGGVIVARMNRRQAGELEVALSREQGQRAELRDFGSIAAGTTIAGKPAATAPTDQPAVAVAAGVDKTVAEKPATDSFRLTPHPQDEPVDVVIVVKPATTVTPAAAAKPDSDSKK